MHARAAFLVLMPALLLGSAARAQVGEQIRTVTQYQVQRLERQAREHAQAREYFKGLGEVRPGTRAGGWFSHTFLDFNELDHARQSPDPIDRLLLTDVRLWASHVFDARHEAYVRVRKADFDFTRDDTLPFLDLRTKEQFDLDLAYFDFPCGGASLRAGRSFMLLGRGLVLAEVLDGLQVRRRFGSGLVLEALAGTSLHRQDNLDTRVLGFDRGHNDRQFLGLQGSYRTRRHGILYHGFALAQIDETASEDPNQDLLDFQYQSRYFGAGASGLLHHRLGFATEAVLERGSSRGFDGRAAVRASALTANLDYRFPEKWTPVITLDYGLGTGDPNRLSVTSGLDLGPSASAGDENFMYFGQYDGGLALAPRLSNLQVWRLGMRCRPFVHRIRWPSDLVAGFKVSTYHKHRVQGAISDPLASQPLSDVGTALDLFGSWRVLSDLNILVEYGGFKPGEAYRAGARDTTERFGVTSTLSF